MNLEDILNKVSLAEYVGGYVTGTIMTWGFMQKTFIKDHKAHIEELKERINSLEERLIDLEDSRVKIALKKSTKNNPTEYEGILD